jgi:peroxiredoxin
MAQTAAQAPTPDEDQKSISQRLSKLRQLPDDERAKVTKQLALDIRKLPASEAKVGLASGLANLATEGDFGRDTLQEVTTTLAEALQALPATTNAKRTDAAYAELAQLVHYEKMHTSLKAPQLTAALAKLEDADHRFQETDFTLTDLEGKAWTLKSLHGKVVLVNFWATWCPPCRKELPDLQALYDRFKDRGLVVLGISDEDVTKVQPFVTEHKMTYPILLDPGRKVNQLFDIQGIPHSLFYNRDGKLVAQAIDMRTQKQFLELLNRAGLH